MALREIGQFAARRPVAATVAGICLFGVGSYMVKGAPAPHAPTRSTPVAERPTQGTRPAVQSAANYLRSACRWYLDSQYDDSRPGVHGTVEEAGDHASIAPAYPKLPTIHLHRMPDNTWQADPGSMDEWDKLGCPPVS